MTELERKQFILGLKVLRSQNVEFLATWKKLKKPTVKKLKKRMTELEEYIKQIENGGECTRTLREWCNIFSDILAGGDL